MELVSCYTVRTIGGSIHAVQTTYVDELLRKFKMSECKPTDTPMVAGLILGPGDPESKEGEEAEFDVKIYQSFVGAVLYLGLCTRPDVAYTAGVLSRYTKDPRHKHWRACKHLMRYLKKTRTLGITFKGKPKLVGYADSSLANDPSTRKSVSGYVIKLGEGSVDWSSKLQPVVALSSCESEYICLCTIAKRLN